MRRAAIVASLIAAAATGWADQPACRDAIGPDNAQRIFDELRAFAGGDGCALEDVRTKRDTLQVEWRKDGAAVPPVEVRPRSCGQGTTANGPAFALSAPPATIEACPSAVERLKALVATEAIGAPVSAAPAPVGWVRPIKLAAIAVAVAALLLGGLVTLLRRRRRAGPPPATPA